MVSMKNYAFNEYEHWIQESLKQKQNSEVKYFKSWKGILYIK
jgi:hypothetical protein